MSDADKKAAWNEWLATDEGKSWQAENKAPVSFLVPTSAARAELQVSLLNEIGLTLTAMAKELAEQAETLKTYKLSLEGMQGLLVEMEHSFDVIAEVQANSYDAVVTKFTHIEKCLTHIEECAKRGRVRGDETCERLSAIEGHLERLISGRKTGKTARKRPVHKAGKRLKTSKL